MRMFLSITSFIYIAFTLNILNIKLINMSAVCRRIKFNSCLYTIKKIVPPLERNSHKGANGRIGIIGGSPGNIFFNKYNIM